MLLDWALSKKQLVDQLDECSRACAAAERREKESSEAATMLSIRVMDLEELLERALRAGENLNRVILSGDPGDETSVP